SPELYIKYYKKILDYTFEKIKSGHFIIERRFSIALEKIFSDVDTQFTDFRNPCGAFLGQIAYDKDGNIFCCDEARGRQSLILAQLVKNATQK
ncbi:MAG: hypothetical protein RBQ66_09010, partial [Candidatus Cloacimonadaceae bacterium]|nr:hypothetical protein [Candidatus Cloacimonadaceae bacterium]